MWKNIGKWLSGIAATVVAGVLVWWLTQGIRPKPGPQPPAPPSSQSSTHPAGPKKKLSEPTVVRRSMYRSPLDVGARLYYYDFDKPERLSNVTPAADFFFKPDSGDQDTRIGVVPHNGASFAPRSPDLFPWEIDQGKLTSAHGVYSVPQNKNIPCITSDGTNCTFKLTLEDDGEFAVSFVLYKLR